MKGPLINSVGPDEFNHGLVFLFNIFVLDFKNDRGNSYEQTSVGKSLKLLPTDPRKETTVWHPSIGSFKFPRVDLTYRAFLIFVYYFALL